MYEELLDASAHDAEAGSHGLIAGHTAGFAVADVVDVLPEAVLERALAVLDDEVADEDAGIACGRPLDGDVPAGVEHQTVRHIVLEQIVVQNAGLTQHHPVRRRVVEKISLRAQLGDRIEVVDARHERIADAAPGVFPVSVAVLRDRTDVNVLDLVRSLGVADGVDQLAGAVEVRLLCGLGIVVRLGRNDSRAVNDIVAAVDAICAILIAVEVTHDDFEVFAVLLLKFCRELLVGRLVSEQDDALELAGLHDALEHLAAHRAGSSGDKHNFLVHNSSDSVVRCLPFDLLYHIYIAFSITFSNFLSK